MDRDGLEQEPHDNVHPRARKWRLAINSISARLCADMNGDGEISSLWPMSAFDQSGHRATIRMQPPII